MNLRLTALASLALLVPTAAIAQEPSPSNDWTLGRNADEKLLAATITFDNGIGVVARCMNGVYDLMVVGLPPAQPRTTRRNLTLIVGEGDDESTREAAWTVGGSPDIAFSRVPAMAARLMAKGGKFQIVVPAVGEGRRTRYVMELPASDAALEETLRDCDRPLYDLRDDAIENEDESAIGPATGIVWVRRPSPRFPPPVGGRMVREAYAVLSCRTEANGRLSECQVESEQPAGYNVAAEALEGVRGSRVALSPEARDAGLRLEGRLIVFAVNFRLAN